MGKLLALLGLLLVAACGPSGPPLSVMGAYRLDDGRLVSIRRSEGETLRYRLFDTGRSGRLHPASDGQWVAGSGFSDREPVALTVEFARDSLVWSAVGAEPIDGHRVFDTREIEFPSDDVLLRGNLLVPPGDGPFPAVVLVHGSGDDSAVEYYYSGDFLAAHGILTLVFCKRGTGTSEGEYTFDYDQLAGDVSAAIDFLLEEELVDGNRVGLCGYSQGGWVAPLVARRDDRVKFVSVSYGMIESATDEAVWETQQLLRSRGVNESEIEDATPLISSAVAIVASGFDEGWDRFFEEKRRTDGAPWRDQLGDSPVEQMLRYPKWLTRLVGPRMAPRGLDWHYSSEATLDTLDIPMTWLLALEDSSAPNHETIRKLEAYRNAGKDYELVLFENAEHGMIAVDPVDGDQGYPGYAPGYFAAEVENVLRMSAGMN